MTDWTEALCAGNPDPWTMPKRIHGRRPPYTPEGMAKIEAAREACWRCPLIDACRHESAYADPRDGHIWAGLTPDERGNRLRLRPHLDPARECGTEAGYMRHRRAGETPCEPCRLAQNAARRDRRRRRREAS